MNAFNKISMNAFNKITPDSGQYTMETKLKVRQSAHNNNLNQKHYLRMNHVMRNPVYAICEQQRHRSSAQSDQRLCCSLPE